MKKYILLSWILIPLFSLAQNSNKESKLTNTIKFEALENTKDKALTNFLLYANEKGFPSEIGSNHQSKKEKPEGRHNGSIKSSSETSLQISIEPKEDPLKKSTTKIQTVKSNYTNIMMGLYEAYLEIWVDQKGDQIFIYVSGFSYINSFGNRKTGKMLKGGKEASWAQKDLYKMVKKLIKEYEGREELIYLNL